MAHHDTRDKIALLSAVLGVFVLVAALFGSLSDALLFLLALGLFASPGLPIARRWFSGIESWLVGAALGFLSSSLAASLLHRLQLASPLAVLATPTVLFLVATVIAPHIELRVRAGEPERGERLWAIATAFIVLAIVAIPFLKVGATTPSGIAFRAYFSADLMTHLSVVAELQKGGFPLVNPFYAGSSLGYYWLFFTFPAAFGALAGNQATLLSVYLTGGVLFGALLFAVMRRVGLPSSRAFIATAIALTAASYEGLLALLRHEPFTDINVDALARWAFQWTSLDGLHRSLLYTPQHLFSYSLLLVLLLLVIRREPSDRTTAVFSGSLLGGMAGTSIVTAMLAGPWLVWVLFWRRRNWRSFLGLAFWTTSSALALLVWFVLLGYFGEAGSALTFRVPAWPELVSVLGLDAGALFLLAASRRGRRSSLEWEVMLLAGLALVAVLFLDLRGYEGVWMAWRAGSVLLLSLAILAAAALRTGLRPLHGIIVVPALLTVVLDVHNAQDIGNRRMSAGNFRWTTTVSADEWQALRFLREETAEDAVVQWDVRARDLGEWAIIPALAERRMAVGFPIFLLDLRKYRVRERRHVTPIFASGDAERAHREAVDLGIDYLFIGRAEVNARGARLRPLFESPHRFRKVFQNAEVTLLEVLPR
jgi:hypothetical protein